MATPSLPRSPGVSDDSITALAELAVRDADHAIIFLEEMGLRATPEHPVDLPPNFVLELGAAMRLLEWELDGVSGLLDADLPTVKQAVLQAFHLLHDPSSDNPDLTGRVLALLSSASPGTRTATGTPRWSSIRSTKTPL
jgi:hypothetical protein